MKFNNTFDYHKQLPNISMDDYGKTKKIELGKSIKDKTKIYLDTKYWVCFRNVKMGVEKDANIIDLYELLKLLIESKRAICPISDIIFDEILKQKDEKKLNASIELIDSFSKGVVLISEIDRVMLEILYFLRKNTKSKNTVFPSDLMVWTKPALIYGDCIPSETAFSREEELAIQKSYFDLIWQQSFSDMLRQIGINKLRQMPNRPNISDTINKDCANNISELDSFKTVFRIEIAGTIDAVSPLIQNSLIYFYQKETGNVFNVKDTDASKHVNMFKNLISHLFEQKKDNGFLPTLKVNAGIHAGIRWDKKRLYKENDFPDFEHAKAAIPYCDMFFTEKSLKHLLESKSLAYDKEYGCKIAAKPTDALSLAQTI